MAPESIAGLSSVSHVELRLFFKLFQSLRFHALLVLAGDLDVRAGSLLSQWRSGSCIVYPALLFFHTSVVIGDPRSGVVHDLVFHRILFFLCSSAKISNPHAVGR